MYISVICSLIVIKRSNHKGSNEGLIVQHGYIVSGALNMNLSANQK